MPTRTRRTGKVPVAKPVAKPAKKSAPVKQEPPSLFSAVSSSPVTLAKPRRATTIVASSKLAPKAAPDLEKAQALAEVADAIEADYERLYEDWRLTQPINTWRKLDQQEAREQQVDILQWSGQVARSLEAGHRDGTLPLLLRKIKTRNQIAWLTKRALRYGTDTEILKVLGHAEVTQYTDSDISELFDRNDQSDWTKATRRMLRAVGITEPQQLRFVLQELQTRFQVPEGEELLHRRIRYMRRRVALRNIDDFYPTHRDVVEQKMLPNIRLFDGCRILEPSAGYGSIVEVLLERAKEMGITIHIDCVERSFDCREILELMGLNLIGRDFLELEPTGDYDVVIANPPFGQNGDLCITHVYHMEKFLKHTASQLVAITHPGWTRETKGKKSRKAFRDWVSERGHWQMLDREAFAQSDRPIKIETAMVVIRR